MFFNKRNFYRFCFSRVTMFLLGISIFLLSNTLLGKEKIAILAFDANGVEKSVAKTVSEIVATEIVNTGVFTVIERSNIKKILNEHKLQLTGITDASTASELGSLLNAKYLFLGTVGRLGGKIIITCKVVDVAHGKINFAIKNIADSKDKIVFVTENMVKGLIYKITGKSYKNYPITNISSNKITYGDLIVETWTNKGRENVVFKKNEIMEVFVRVNRPSYVRFVYHFEDGTRILLLDNHFIDASSTNKVYKIPDKFECSKPFGHETLQVFASTEKFQPTQTQKADGYLILKEDINKFLKNTRGFKVKQEKAKKGFKKSAKVLIAEDKIVIKTTK